MELENRTRTPTQPPSYDEAVRESIGPPPVYTETDENRPTEQPIPGTGRNRFAAWTEQTRVVVTQPSRETRQTYVSHVVVEQPSNRVEQNKSYSCNCFCAACKWRPCSKDGECFCYNCVLFALYAAVCGLGVFCCLCWKKICPETFGECPTRDTGMMESYTFRDDTTETRCYWTVCGPVCCLSCNEHSDVCPLSTPCEKRFGMKCIRKMTCYCGGSERSDCTVNLFDEQACGFIWDCKQCGFKSY